MDKNFTNENPIVVAVDIGTTKVCAMAGRRDLFGRLEILAVGKVDSDGVLRGVVSNIEKTVRAISDAVRIVEQKLQKTVTTVHVGIAGQHIKSVQHRGSKLRDNADVEISGQDIRQLIMDMYKLNLPPGDKILHVYPQEYSVDNEQGVVDPIGMSGVRLEANFHIITGQITAFNNIVRCVEKAGLRLADLTLEPIASASSVLSEEEKEAGIALVDIGGGTTDVCVYYDGIIRHAAIIPFGGNAVTRDIKEGCNVMLNQAEKLKTKFGYALADEMYDDKIITIPGLKGRENKEISQRNLALIIQARMEEILDYVMLEIEKSGYERKLTGGIVLTGGGALLNGVDKLTALHSGLESRIGLPIEFLAHGYNANVSNPIYATTLGLLMEAIGHVTMDEVEDKLPAGRDTSRYEVELVGTPYSKGSVLQAGAPQDTPTLGDPTQIQGEAGANPENEGIEQSGWMRRVWDKIRNTMGNDWDDEDLR
ncbi:MAG TPA: cell division protein FtsA [Saprospiraceae bacterium]|jgi:cell division protein FtsA|nr:cell division protein FtsA [Saprospiraceae bacterium]